MGFAAGCFGDDESSSSNASTELLIFSSEWCNSTPIISGLGDGSAPSSPNRVNSFRAWTVSLSFRTKGSLAQLTGVSLTGKRAGASGPFGSGNQLDELARIVEPVFELRAQRLGGNLRRHRDVCRRRVGSHKFHFVDPNAALAVRERAPDLVGQLLGPRSVERERAD